MLLDVIQQKVLMVPVVVAQLLLVQMYLLLKVEMEEREQQHQ